MNNNAVLEIGLEKLDMEAAARIAEKFALKEIFLVDAKISRNPLIISPETLSLEHKCSTDTLISDKEKYIVLCNFQVAAFDGKDQDKPVMKIEASFCNSYVNKLEITIPEPDDADSLLAHVEYLMNINPISNTWPYWREFVQNMSARMGFPALTVPLLEIVTKKPEGKERKRQAAMRKSTKSKGTHCVNL